MTLPATYKKQLSHLISYKRYRKL